MQIEILKHYEKFANLFWKWIYVLKYGVPCFISEWVENPSKFQELRVCSVVQDRQEDDRSYFNQETCMLRQT